MKFVVSLAFVVMISTAAAQAPADSVNQVVDSLFVRASTGNINYQAMIEPAKKALAQMGVVAVPRLIEKTETEDAREMQTLEDIFKQIGPPATPFLIEALASNNAYRRRLSVRIIGEMADTSAVAGLLKYDRDSDFRMRAGAISALGKIGDRRGVALSREALKDPDYLVRTSAAISLSNLKDSTSIYPLIIALSDPYHGVRYSASGALSNIGKPAVKPVLDALLRPADTLALYLLIETSGNLNDRRFVQPLMRILESPDPFARAFAAESLGKIGTPEAINAVRKRYEIETHPFVISKIEALVLK
jgi:HEAT repeat protein